MRRTALLLIVALLALAGCGGSSEETTTSGPIGADPWPQEVKSGFERNPDCKPPKGASRWGCSVGSYRCQGVVTDRGWSISCAKPGRSLVFRITPD